jgi:hypothetical protein
MSTRDKTVQKYIDKVRAYLRDFPELNRLIEGVESSDPHIVEALEDALEDWNLTPPLLRKVTLENHPAPRLLVKKAAMSTLDSVIPLQMRNQVSYSDGQGTSVSTSDKAPAYQSEIRRISDQYEQAKLRFKIAKNIDDGWDSGVASEISVIGNGYII